MGDRIVTRSRVISAPPEIIFDILTDPRMHPVIDGSGMVRGRIQGPARLRLGSKFGMRMRILGRIPYAIRNVVVEYEQDRRIAWRHMFRHRWRYELEPRDDGHTTFVKESFDYGPSVYPLVLEWLDVPEAHARNMERTLDNLARIAAERATEVEGGIAG